ncbi:hypothetical protein F5J12DRAFT_843115 [Pisolithus orientalis]|uniref:uncharacterized protein n=1 Tax=Pisolithus orientalis TaxID=936130 RepID=UPI0022253E67|nr:uncharacterized protein F5J12DRAFT_843115 [Pisolithus orientalis]KAI6001585.1 hypothetical protein F5J12DRAFT_843115 [Pisolithus orientalis]
MVLAFQRFSVFYFIFIFSFSSFSQLRICISSTSSTRFHSSLLIVLPWSPTILYLSRPACVLTLQRYLYPVLASSASTH